MHLRNAPLPKARGGQRVWRTADIATLCEWFSEPPEVIRALSDQLIHRMLCDSDGGFAAGGGERTSGGKYSDDGANNGRVPNLAIRRIENRRADEVAVAARGFFAALEQAAQHLEDAVDCAQKLAALPIEKAKELVEEAKPERGASCVNPACERWIENTSKDRIRSGRCDACYKFWTRHSREQDRPLDLCVKDVA